MWAGAPDGNRLDPIKAGSPAPPLKVGTLCVACVAYGLLFGQGLGVHEWIEASVRVHTRRPAIASCVGLQQEPAGARGHRTTPGQHI